MMTDPISARPTPPGAILRTELEKRGWTQKDLAEILGRPAQVITEIVRGSKQITPDTALELGAALGTPPDFWTALETKYRLDLARRKHAVPPAVAQRAKLFQRLPITEMVKRRWIRGSNDVNDLHSQACEFLGVDSIDEDPEMFASLRRSTVADDVVGAQRAWVRRVELVAEQQTVHERFSAQNLRNSIPSIRALAANEESVVEVPRLLAKLGVRFVVVSPIPRTRVDGAAIFGTSGPIVGLSLRYDRIDWFWFTLMHEIAHLALDHKGGHLDALEPSATKDKDEKEADSLAEESLISRRAFNEFTKQHPRISKTAVEEFAHAEKLHPGVIVGRLHFTQVLPYSHFRSYLVRVAHHLKPWTDSE